MACCGGKKRVAKYLGVKLPDDEQTALEANMAEGIVRAQYIGARSGSFSMFGPATGMEYRFSRSKPAIDIQPADAELFDVRPDFVILRGTGTQQPQPRVMTAAELAAANVVRQPRQATINPQRITPPVETRGTTVPNIPGIARP